jgi:hypothetical protein
MIKQLDIESSSLDEDNDLFTDMMSNDSEMNIDSDEESSSGDNIVDSYDDSLGEGVDIKKSLKDTKREKELESYMKPPKKTDFEGWRFPRRVTTVLTSNNQTAIRTQLNKNVFRTMYTMKSQSISKSRIKRKSTQKKGPIKTKTEMTRAQKTLNRTIQCVFAFYDKHIVQKKTTKRTHIVSDATRHYIHTILFDYYDIVGKSPFFIGNLIKCGFWGLLSLVNSRTPITSSDIKLKNLSQNTLETISRKGINMSGYHEFMLRYAPADNLIQYIQDSRVYDNGVPLLELKYLTEPKLVKFLCDNELIDLSNQAIKFYHESCHISLLTYLLSNDIIKINESHIKRVLRQKKIVKKKNTITKRYRTYRRFRRRHGYKTKVFNKNANDQEFKLNGGKYFMVVHDKGINIPIENYTKYVFLSNKMHDDMIDMINYAYVPGKKRFKFDTHEKYDFFSHVCEKDDIDRLHILLNNNIITIEELHHNNDYIVCVIRCLAEKIARYMCNTLKIKYVNFSATGLWGWSMTREPNTKILASLRLMKSLDIQIPNTLLTTMLNKKKSADIIDVLINEFGMKIQKCHLQQLKHYPVSVFNKYSKDIVFNKKTFINSLIGSCVSNSRRYWRKSRYANTNKLALHLISKIDDKNKIKAARKYCTNALLNDNTKICETLKNKYNVNIDVNLVKKSLDKINTHGLSVLNSMVSKTTYKEDITTIKNNFTEEDLFTLILKKPRHCYDDDAPPIVYSILKDLNLEYSTEKIHDLITQFNTNSGWQNPGVLNNTYQTILANIIKGNTKYINNDHEYMRVLVTILWNSSLMNTIKKINTKKHNCTQFFTLNTCYGKILNNMYSGIDTTNTIDLIIKAGVVITPNIYNIILVGYRASQHNNEIWNRPNVSQNIMKKLLMKEKRMLKETYNKLILSHGYLKKMYKQKKLKLITKYVPTEDEIPEMFEYYNELANIEIIDRDHRYYSDDDDRLADDRAIVLDLEKALKDAHYTEDNNLINKLEEKDSDDIDMSDFVYSMDDEDDLDNPIVFKKINQRN